MIGASMLVGAMLWRRTERRPAEVSGARETTGGRGTLAHARRWVW
jgi:hypothetical protein